MDRLTMVQEALRELGEVPAEQLAAFIQRQYGVRIEARYVPLFKASVRGRELLETQRQQRRILAGPAGQAPPAAA
jgi:hypothetical protein